MALVVFTVFYIPVGLHIIANWLSKKFSKNSTSTQKGSQRWFFILMVVGFVICAVKLVRTTPLRWERQGYRDVAEWLNKNTVSADIIAVPDKRMAFYAERTGLEYNQQIPEQANYVVKIVRSEDEKLVFGKEMKEEYSTSVNKHKKSGKLVTYKVIH